MRDVQRSVARPIAIDGVGLHTGSRARVRILPAPADAGITFLRRDLGGSVIPTAHACLRGSRLATTLARKGRAVSTVEHLLAALQGLGIDNARIEVDGPEVPILDGSARPFVDSILAAGLRRLRSARRFLTLRQPVSVKQGGGEILALPSNGFEATYAIDFPHPAIGYQAISVRLTDEVFASSIAPARTFCLLRDVESMRALGLARGGSLQNALVVGDDGVLNGSLRFPDECVRHKVLDLIGDLALLGSPLRAHVIVFKGGHRLHAALVGRILCDRAAWSVSTSEDRLPATELARFAGLSRRLVPRSLPLTA